MLLKLIKLMLKIAAVILYVLLLVGAVLVLKWPLWSIAFLIIATIGLFLGWLFIKKIMQRRNDQAFVDQVIQQDDARIQSLAKEEQDKSRELQRKWREAIETLKTSHLKKQGNSLYVLPWYLILGESGSGKTTAIQSAGLTSPFADYSRVAGISGTKNCDWWFFENAIIIDAAGRYAIPVDEDADKHEWREFMSLLTKYRKKEPLNGLIITVPADKLMTGNLASLKDDGQTLRKRLNELMISLGAKFPVYLLVTKCDLIQGMSRFCDELSAESLDQAMGVVNDNLQQDSGTFLENAFSAIGERLRDLRLLILNKPRMTVADPTILLFPDEFAKLKANLEIFALELFQKNPYQETPLCRGLFFSSGCQEGVPYSHFLQNLGLLGSREALPGTSRGLFLHDLFAVILPRDRALFAPTQRALEWSLLTRNIGLAAWVTLVVALCGLLSFAFVKNLAPLRSVPEEFMDASAFSGKLPSDFTLMKRFHDTIIKVQSDNRNWLIPRFGLNESLEAEEAMKQRYGMQYKRFVDTPFDSALQQKISVIDKATANAEIADTVKYLLSRIAILKRKQAGDDLFALDSNLLPSFDLFLQNPTIDLSQEGTAELSELYRSYLQWNTIPEDVQLELTAQQQYLQDIITRKGNTYQWLVNWANADETLSPVSMQTFIGEYAKDQSDIQMVEAAFTRAGKEKIDSFLQQIVELGGGGETARSARDHFTEWYQQQYLQSWQEFAKNFLKNLNATTQKNKTFLNSSTLLELRPFQSLIRMMGEELSPFAEPETPQWLVPVFRYNLLEKYVVDNQKKAEQGLLDKAGQTGKKILAGLNKGLEKVTQGGQWKNLNKTVDAYSQYKEAVAALAPACASVRSVFALATETFKDDPDSGTSAVIKYHHAVTALRHEVLAGNEKQSLVSDLLEDEFSHFWATVLEETGCYLNSIWETEVLAEIRGVSKQEDIEELLFSDDGFARKFAQGKAAPFLRRSRSEGYRQNALLKDSVPFRKDFLAFLSKGSIPRVKTLPFYNVVIEALPTEANPGAVQPHATHLELVCAGGGAKLDNYNFPVIDTFTWTPGRCSDANLKIEIGNMTFSKKYAGELGFVHFVKDFKDGQKVFKREDFPSQQAELLGQGVEYINVNFRLKGYAELLSLLRPSAGRTPDQVALCRKKQ